MAEDWQEVRRLSDHLAQNSINYGYPAIGARARRVCDETDKPGEDEGPDTPGEASEATENR